MHLGLKSGQVFDVQSYIPFLFHTGLYTYNSTYQVLTYHQRNQWNWHQSGERHGNKKHKVIQCSILMLSLSIIQKHTAIKNSVTMHLSIPWPKSCILPNCHQFSQNVLPALNGRGRSKHGVSMSSSDVCLTGEVLVTLHRKLRCMRRLLDTTEWNGTHGFRTTLLSTLSLRGSPFLGWQVWPFLHWSGRCEHRECLPHCAPPPGPVASVPGSAPPTHWQPQN